MPEEKITPSENVSRWEYNLRHDALENRIRDLELFRASFEAKAWTIGKSIAIILISIQVAIQLVFHFLKS